jgi:hypothetical protein
MHFDAVEDGPRFKHNRKLTMLREIAMEGLG